MIVMPANSSGLFTGYLMGRFPGRLGWIIGPGGWREPRHFIEYCFDNGAFPVWSKGKVWDEAPFYELCQRITERQHKPRWIAVPDVVANREGTLRSWEHHSPRVASFGVPLAFVVQDGMTPNDVPEDAQVVFVGGSTDWKWANLKTWTANFPRVHVGRVNGERGLWLCHKAGAESCDGTGWFRGDQNQLAGLIRYLEQTTISPKPQNNLMKPSTKIAIAGLLSAAGSVLTAFASEFSGEAPASPESAAAPEQPKVTKPKKEKATAPTAVTEPVTETAAEAAEDASAGGKTYEDMKAVIAPLVQEGRGEEVKQVIRKHAGADGTLKTMDPKHYAAFEKDITALTY